MSRAKPRRYGRGIIRATPHGTFQAEVNYGDRRHRKTFKNLGAVRAWIDATTVDVIDLEIPLDALGIREARRALRILPAGVSLVDAARAYARNAREVAPCALNEAVQRYLVEKIASGRRPRTVAQYRQHLNRLSVSFPAVQVHEMNGAVLDWVNAQGVVGHTRSHLRATLHAFFRWAVQMGYARKNPAEAIATSRVDQTLPAFLRVKQAGALLSAAVEHDAAFVPFLAVGLFAGVRTAELMRLESKAVTTDRIHVGSAAAKLRHQRFVTVPANLAAWLRELPPVEGPLCPVREAAAGRRLRAIREAAGLRDWPHNALRHSFATYHLALHRNAPLTAHEMGHSNVEMLYRHYRNLATPQEAAEFFEVTPKSVIKASKPQAPLS